MALLFELVEGGRENVGVIATGRALDWADYLRGHALRLYGAATVTAENGARLIAERRPQLPERFTARDVQVKGWAGMSDREAVSAALDLLSEAGHLRGEFQPIGALGGRPSMAFEWNPKLNNRG